MPVDRGGLQYRIKVEDAFSAPLGSFRKGVDQSREAFSRLKKELGTPVSGKAVSEEVRKITAASRNATNQSARQRRELARLTRQEQSRVKSLQELNQEARRREVNEQKAIDSGRRNFRFQRQISSVTRARAEAEQRVTTALNRRLQSEQLMQVLKERGLATDKELRRQLGLQTTQERRLEQIQRSRSNTINRLRQAQRQAASERLIQIRAEDAALRRITQARIREETNRRLTAAGRPDLIPGATTAGAQQPERALTFFQRLSRALVSTDNHANRLSFTFRRLFGILAAFTLARQIISQFNNLIRTLIAANAQIETVELGVASLIASVSDIRNTSGEAVSGIEALSIAQREARRQTVLLRRDALRTTATFEELADAFQVGLGPGLRAGLSIDEVRQFTRQISLAAQAIGLEQRQLAEEIRSILSGTINLRQTRIAAVLGITNEDIRNAREAGELFEFLTDRFSAFEEAGVLAADTFSGIVGRVRDGTRLLLAEGGVFFFEDLKDFLRDILNTIQQLNDETGNIELNPSLLQAIRALSQGLSSALEAVRGLGQEIGLEGVISAASAIGEGIAVAARLVTQFVAGVADALGIFAAIAKIVGSISRTLRSAFGLDPKPVENILRLIGQILTTLVVIQFLVSVIGPAVRLILLLTTVLDGVIKSIQNGLKVTQALLVSIRAITISINLPILIILSLVLAVLAATGLLSKAITLISNTLSRIAGPLFRKLDNELTQVLDRADTGVEGLVFGSLEGIEKIRKAISGLNDEIEGIRASSEASLSVVIDSPLGADFNADDQVARTLAAFRTIGDEGRDAIKTVENELETITAQSEELADELEAVEQKLREIGPASRSVRDLRADPELRRELEEIPSQIQEIEERLEGLRDQQALGSLAGRAGEFTDAIEEAERSLELLQQRQAEIDNQLRGQNQIFDQAFFERRKLLEERNRIEAEIFAREQRSLSLSQQRNQLQQTYLDRQIALARVEFERLNATAQEAVLRQEVVRQFALQAALAQLTGNEEDQRLVALRQQRAELSLNAQIEQQNIQNTITRLGLQQELVQSRIDELEPLRQSNDLTVAQANSLSEAIRLRDQILTQIDLEQQKLAGLAEITEAELVALDILIQRQSIRAGGSLRDQILLAVEDLARELPSRFEILFDTLGQAVSSFASLVGSAIADAFDPTTDVNLRERFGQFLKGIAQQIITTMTEIAVTAILLDALSGGILSAFLPGSRFRTLFGGLGFNEGGRIDEKAQKNARAHPRHFQRARGFHSGGAPATRGRPRNLHPKDKVPVWTAVNEWVINAKSTAKAGHDAMARINAGMFESGELRAAVGLGPGPAKVAVSMANKAGKGLATGGRIRGSDSGGTTTVSGGPSIAVIAPTEEAVKRLLSSRGGRQAFMDVIREDAGDIRAILDL